MQKVQQNKNVTDDEVKYIIQNKGCVQKRHCECKIMISKLDKVMENYKMTSDVFEFFVQSISHIYDNNQLLGQLYFHAEYDKYFPVEDLPLKLVDQI